MNNGHNRPECISTGSQNGDQTSVGGHAQRQICIFAFFVWLLSRRSVNFCIHQWFPTCGSQTISELLFFYRCCHFYEMTVKMIWLLVDFFKIILTWHRRRSQVARITSIKVEKHWHVLWQLYRWSYGFVSNMHESFASKNSIHFYNIFSSILFSCK